ncbi:glycosyl transferase family 90-domain-containing protein [Aspergillus filifer]
MISTLRQFPLRFLGAGTVLSLLLLTFLVFGRGSSYGFGGGQSWGYTLKSPSTTCSESEPYPDITNTTQADPSQGTWTFDPHRDANNHALSHSQCQSAFPKLYTSIDRTANTLFQKNKLITYEQIDTLHKAGGVDGNGNGLIRGAIIKGQLHIIDFGPQPYTFSRGKATLHALNRALVADPEKKTLPDVEFVLSTDDFTPVGMGPVWSYSKRVLSEEGEGEEEGNDSNVWLMPDFGYWSWPEVKVGSYMDIRARIASVDSDEAVKEGTGIQFHDKKKQLLWRGSVTSNADIRSSLLTTTRGKSWSSTREINWDDPESTKTDVVPMEDHCAYQFLAHTEGRSFSGKGKYLLNCRSVIISHKLEWEEMHHSALISSGPDANYVQVERDWSDLERKIEHLLDNPEVAERIADNAVRTFRDRYLTPAAESCFWRHLVRRYGDVSEFEPVLEEVVKGRGKVKRGVSFDDWVLGF